MSAKVKSSQVNGCMYTVGQGGASSPPGLFWVGRRTMGGSGEGFRGAPGPPSEDQEETCFYILQPTRFSMR